MSVRTGWGCGLRSVGSTAVWPQLRDRRAGGSTNKTILTSGEGLCSFQRFTLSTYQRTHLPSYLPTYLPTNRTLNQILVAKPAPVDVPSGCIAIAVLTASLGSVTGIALTLTSFPLLLLDVYKLRATAQGTTGPY
jgi:hypothetical protein